MSWGANLKYRDGELTEVNVSGVTSEEHKEQYQEVLDCVRRLCGSGALGNLPCNVTLSGHGNPNHEPAAGWSNDFVSISIYQEAT